MTAYTTQQALARATFAKSKGNEFSSVKQRDFIKKLVGEKANGESVMEIIIDRWGALDMLPKRDASKIIDQLMALPRKSARPVAAPAEPLVAGFYLHNGEIVKVQKAVHGSGNLYAKRLVVALDGGSFEYSPGLVRDIKPEEKLTLEQAKEFGHLYGICCRCGATLTDETSIANGIGPVCGGKF